MSRQHLPRPVILGLTLILGTAAALGLSFGFWVARLDETAVINRVAAEYVRSGGRAKDCVARPGAGRVWIVVTCGAGDSGLRRGVNRLGFGVDLPLEVPGT